MKMISSRRVDQSHMKGYLTFLFIIVRWWYDTQWLCEKRQLIHENEEKYSYHILANKYKISIGSMSNIIKHKGEYMENYEQNENSNRKQNLRDEFSQQLGQKVYEWFCANWGEF
jgi:predicted DNA-binding protein YlxM (UPF0122 family)